MKIYLIPAITALCGLHLSYAQVLVKPISGSNPATIVTTPPTTTVTVPLEQTSGVVIQTRAVSDETLAVLRDIRSIAPEREAEIQAALKVDSDAEANVILDTILADVKDDAVSVQAARLALDVVNRTAQEREDYVAYMTRRLQGQVTITDAPASFRSRVVTVPVATTTAVLVPAQPTTEVIVAAPATTQVVVPVPATTEVVVQTSQPRFYGPGRRVVTYRTREEIPPVLRASGQLKRVEIAEVGGSPFRQDLVLVDDMSPAYIAPDAYAVTYTVNPDTEITRSDILFEQGTTNFADAYSYDVVADLAAAIRNQSLAGQAFIIEGHASAEGEYSANLSLSQARSERIVRELVRFGVSSSQLVPVGYGESEAVNPANAPEALRIQDHRVTVFALQTP